MSVGIPVFQSISADFTQRIELNGQLVTLRLTYNIRNEFFSLRFTDPDGVQLSGMKLVPNFLLLRPHLPFINFSGDLMVVKDDASLGDEITYDNLGAGWNLYYLTEAEAEAWGTANGMESKG